MLKTSDFYYDLPEELIAQTPVEPRDSSRMLVYERKTDTVEHKIFRDIENIFTENDLLVVNNQSLPRKNLRENGIRRKNGNTPVKKN